VLTGGGPVCSPAGVDENNSAAFGVA